MSPRDHWSHPCRAALRPWMQLWAGAQGAHPFQAAHRTRKNAGIQAGKGHWPITGRGNTLKRSWNFKSLSSALAPAAQTFPMKLHSKLPCQDHTGFCNSLILISQSVFWVRKSSPAQLLTVSPVQAALWREEQQYPKKRPEKLRKHRRATVEQDQVTSSTTRLQSQTACVFHASTPLCEKVNSVLLLIPILTCHYSYSGELPWQLQLKQRRVIKHWYYHWSNF